MPLSTRKLRLPFGLLVGAALCILVYYPGLHGGFIFDDGPNITQNTRLRVDTVTLEGLRQAAFSADAGTLKRPISMLTFWVNYYLTGLDPFYFKLTNLLIHVFNGFGLFWLSRMLLEQSSIGEQLTAENRDWTALAISTIWLLHPLNLTAVLYVVQRMTSLAATFVILGLICYVVGRARLARRASGFPLIFIGLVGCGSLAVLSKENGVLLPIYMAIIELALFRFAALERATARKLKAFFLLTVGIPALGITAFLTTHPEWLAAQYLTRDFTLIERLMTEARVLWLYLRWTIFPLPADLALFHDDIALSQSLFQPVTTIFAFGSIVALLIAAFLLRRRAPLFAFAVLWFLAGHALESSFIGLELVFEHRNYLPILGPLIAGAIAVARENQRLSPQVRLAIPICFAVSIATVTIDRAYNWRSLNSLRLAQVRHHPNSSRSNYEAGLALATAALQAPSLGPENYERIKRYFDRSTSLNEMSVDGLFGLILLNATSGQPTDEASIDRLAQRLSNIPLTFPIVSPFQSFLDWTSKSVVILPERTVRKLFEAALGNPTASAALRAELLSLLSGYYFNVSANPQEAASLALAAVEENPEEPAHHLSLADLAIKLGNFQLAKDELEAVEQTDDFGRFTLQARRVAISLRLAEAKDSSGKRAGPNNLETAL